MSYAPADLMELARFGTQLKSMAGRAHPHAGRPGKRGGSAPGAGHQTHIEAMRNIKPIEGTQHIVSGLTDTEARKLIRQMRGDGEWQLTTEQGRVGSQVLTKDLESGDNLIRFSKNDKGTWDVVGIHTRPNLPGGKGVLSTQELDAKHRSLQEAGYGLLAKQWPVKDKQGNYVKLNGRQVYAQEHTHPKTGHKVKIKFVS